jgi:hypothetical protein
MQRLAKRCIYGLEALLELSIEYQKLEPGVGPPLSLTPWKMPSRKKVSAHLLADTFQVQGMQ